MTETAQFGVLVQALDTPRQFVAFAKRAEELGFTHLWVADSSLHAREVYEYLTLAAVNTESIQIGTGITHPFTRHPAITANAIATLDAISEGRAVLGIGAGDRPVAELGLRPAPVKVVGEAIGLIRRLLAGKRFSYKGEAFQLIDAKLHRSAVDRIPIYVAGSGPKMLGLGGELADGLLIQVGVWPDCLKYALERVKVGLSRAGRSIGELDISAMTYGSVRDERRLAMDESRPFAAWIPQTVPQYCEIAGIRPEDVAAVRQVYRGGELHEAAEAASAATDEMIEKFTMSGTPKEVRDKVDGVLSTGIRHITYFPMGDDRLDGAERFARGVMRHFL